MAAGFLLPAGSVSAASLTCRAWRTSLLSCRFCVTLQPLPPQPADTYITPQERYPPTLFSSGTTCLLPLCQRRMHTYDPCSPSDFAAIISSYGLRHLTVQWHADAAAAAALRAGSLSLHRYWALCNLPAPYILPILQGGSSALITTLRLELDTFPHAASLRGLEDLPHLRSLALVGGRGSCLRIEHLDALQGLWRLHSLELDAVWHVRQQAVRRLWDAALSRTGDDVRNAAQHEDTRVLEAAALGKRTSADEFATEDGMLVQACKAAEVALMGLSPAPSAAAQELQAPPPPPAEAAAAAALTATAPEGRAEEAAVSIQQLLAQLRRLVASPLIGQLPPAEQQALQHRSEALAVAAEQLQQLLQPPPCVQELQQQQQALGSDDLLASVLHAARQRALALRRVAQELVSLNPLLASAAALPPAAQGSMGTGAWSPPADGDGNASWRQLQGATHAVAQYVQQRSAQCSTALQQLHRAMRRMQLAEPRLQEAAGHSVLAAARGAGSELHFLVSQDLHALVGGQQQVPAGGGGGGNPVQLDGDMKAILATLRGEMLPPPAAVLANDGALAPDGTQVDAWGPARDPVATEVPAVLAPAWLPASVQQALAGPSNAMHGNWHFEPHSREPDPAPPTVDHFVDLTALTRLAVTARRPAVADPADPWVIEPRGPPLMLALQPLTQLQELCVYGRLDAGLSKLAHLRALTRLETDRALTGHEWAAVRQMESLEHLQVPGSISFNSPPQPVVIGNSMIVNYGGGSLSVPLPPHVRAPPAPDAAAAAAGGLLFDGGSEQLQHQQQRALQEALYRMARLHMMLEPFRFINEHTQLQTLRMVMPPRPSGGGRGYMGPPAAVSDAPGAPQYREEEVRQAGQMVRPFLTSLLELRDLQLACPGGELPLDRSLLQAGAHCWRYLTRLEYSGPIHLGANTAQELAALRNLQHLSLDNTSQGGQKMLLVSEHLPSGLTHLALANVNVLHVGGRGLRLLQQLQLAERCRWQTAPPPPAAGTATPAVGAQAAAAAGAARNGPWVLSGMPRLTHLRLHGAPLSDKDLLAGATSCGRQLRMLSLHCSGDQVHQASRLLRSGCRHLPHLAHLRVAFNLKSIAVAAAAHPVEGWPIGAAEDAAVACATAAGIAANEAVSELLAAVVVAAAPPPEGLGAVSALKELHLALEGCNDTGPVGLPSLPPLHSVRSLCSITLEGPALAAGLAGPLDAQLLAHLPQCQLLVKV